MRGRSEHLVAISNLGVASAFGFGVAQLSEAIRCGADGIRPLHRFDTSPYSTQFAGLVPGCDHVPSQELFLRLGIAAGTEALAGRALDRSRLGLVVGVSIDHEGVDLHELVERLGDELGVEGPRLTVSVACASGVAALGLGWELLVEGSVDHVLAGGIDVLNEETFAGFDALGVLSPAPCAPFSTPTGTTLGEGAALFLLDRNRGERVGPDANVPGLYLLGYGLSGDGYHATSPSPRGEGVERAIRGALSHARVAPADIGYVNAHGTGTEANDPAEWSALQRVFGPGIAVSSSKSILGHAQGAAGALETAVTALCLRDGTLPHTMHFAGARRRCPDDPVGQSTPRPAVYRVAVCTNSAFGGANAAAVIALDPPMEDARANQEERQVIVTGIGAVGPFGFSASKIAEGVRGRVPGFSVRDYVRKANPRILYHSSQMLLAAASEALRAADLEVRGAARERTGLFVATDRLSPAASKEFRASLHARGPTGPSVRAFADMVLNAPAGACSRALSLRGPHNVISAGSAGGVLALIRAARHLATRTDLDAILAAGLHEGAAEDGSEGAACAVIEAQDVLRAQTRSFDGTFAFRVDGCGIAGPGSARTAVRQALSTCAESIEVWYGPRAWAEEIGDLCSDAAYGGDMRPCGDAGGATSAFGFARAMAEAGGTMLLLTPRSASATGAIILTPWSGDND